MKKLIERFSFKKTILAVFFFSFIIFMGIIAFNYHTIGIVRDMNQELRDGPLAEHNYWLRVVIDVLRSEGLRFHYQIKSEQKIIEQINTLLNDLVTYLATQNTSWADPQVAIALGKYRTDFGILVEKNILLDEMRHQIQQAREEVEASVYAVGKEELEAALQEFLLAEAIYFGDADSIKHQQSLLVLLERLLRDSSNAPGMEQAIHNYRRSFMEMISNYELREKATQRMENSSHHIVNTLMEKIEKANILVDQASRMTDKKATNARRKALHWTGIGLMAALVLILFFARTITLPLQKAVTIAHRLAAGDFRVDIQVNGQNEASQLLAAMKNMVECFVEMLGNVSNTADTVATASHELHDGSQHMTSSLAQQTARISNVSTASTEMSQAVVEIATNTAGIFTSAQDTTNLAKHGEEIVKQSVKEVRAIATTVREAAQILNSLGGRSKQVGEIIGVINDIANQTNLLALNAAIEAARAGEHGRGFSIVADEVKKLSDRTGKATAEIRDMLHEMQNEVTHAVGVVDNGAKRVDAGVELSSQAGNALGNIVKSVAALRTMVEHITLATKEISIVSEAINHDIVDISMVSQEAFTSFEKISRSAENLRELSLNLQNSMGHFRLA